MKLILCPNTTRRINHYNSKKTDDKYSDHQESIYSFWFQVTYPLKNHMAKKKKVTQTTGPALAQQPEINDVDGEPIFHADEEEGAPDA